MNFKTDYRLENFILGTDWQDLPHQVQARLKGCMIDACLELINEHSISPSDIKKVAIHTFRRATMLSKIVPTTADEAQYNIAYPVASAIVHGDFTFTQVMEENLNNPDVIEMMNRLEFKVDENLDARFPAERICKAEIQTLDGNCYISRECEPRGEAKENVGIDWLSDKFYRITGPVLSKKVRMKCSRFSPKLKIYQLEK